MRRTFPRLVVVLSLFVCGYSVRAQSPGQSKTGALPNGRATAPLAEQPNARESLPDLVRRVKPSVVSVLTYDAKGEPLISGSGFFIRPGEVVTNMHVIKGAQRVEIHTLDGKGRTYPVPGALVIDEEADLALLSVNLPEEKSRPLPLSTSLPEEGEQIFLIGNPLRLEGSVSDGIVSAVREVPDVGRIIQITAPVSHGNSGSPLFNMRGQVIGIVTVKVTNGQNINLALGAARIASLQGDQLISFDQIGSKGRSNQPEALADLWYRGGIDSMWLGNYDSALNYFETAANRNPKRAETWIQIGYCKVKQGRNDEAIRAYQHALALRPTSADAHNKLGDAYFYAGRFNEAIAAYQHAARLRPKDGEAYYNLALAYLEIGDREAALAQSRVLASVDAELNKKLLSEMQR
ncbi:MAG TPA: tetratricopeptide repeat-containing serine protease family protein [Pyrinomonadaceae bacterium]|nr:tetratricopeptide repeat-containing serine protease family protein [Pyrinomonadaceae bacterium]